MRRPPDRVWGGGRRYGGLRIRVVGGSFETRTHESADEWLKLTRERIEYSAE
jgi:hypothetical protein